MKLTLCHEMKKTMRKPIGILAITGGLLLSAIYQIYNAFNAFLVSTFAWAGVAVVAAYGIFNLTRWSRYFVVMLAVFSIAGWVDLTTQTYGKGWPHSEVTATIISFVPAAFLLMWWICAAAFTINYIRKHGET